MKKKTLTDLEIKQKKPSDKKQKIALGDALYLFIEPIHKSKVGSKRFVGITRFPPMRSGKQIEVGIGLYGKGFNQWSLRDAREEWDRLRRESKKRGISPRDIQKEERKQYQPTAKVVTLEDAVTGWMKQNSNWSKSTRLDYERRCFNQIMNPDQGGFAPDTSIEDFRIENGGREKLLTMKEFVEDRGKEVQADRNFMVCKQIFDYVIDRWWVKDPFVRNPAFSSKETKKKTSARKVENNPWLKFNQLDILIEDINENRINASETVVTALKFLLLTFQRVGATVGMQFSEIEGNMWTIPEERMKNGEEHYVPLTKPIKQIISKMEDMHGKQGYVFYSARGTDSHLNPSAINNYLLRLGYKNRLTAHGIRATVLTAGVDHLDFDKDIIRRQLAHSVGDKVERSYLHSKYWKQRTEFMNAWSSALIGKGLKI